jgi:hypothetical protein
MYYYPQPPFLIPLLGLFIAVTCGLAFKNLIEHKTRTWFQNPQQANAYQLQGSGLEASYWGICFGVWIFLGGGLLTFGFGVISSYGVALPLTLFTASLVWSQLQEVLWQLKQGGSEALDLK